MKNRTTITPSITRGIFGVLFLCLPVVPLVAETELFEEWKRNPNSALLPDFSRAGYHFGNTTLPDLSLMRMPVFHVNEYGAVPDDGVSDQPAIQRAIDEAALAGGGIVRLGPGRYRINDGDGQWSLMIRHSNIILQGAGADRTIIFSPKAMQRNMGPWTAFPMLLVAAPELKGQELQYGYGEGQPPMEHDWYASRLLEENETAKKAGLYFHVREKDLLARVTKDAARNDRIVTLDQAGTVAPGDRVVLVLRNRAVAEDLLQPWDANQFPYLNWEGYKGNGATANLIRQILTVDQVRGNQVAFKEHLRWKFPVEQQPVLLRYPHIENIGIEGITLKGVVHGGVPQTKTGLYFVNTANGWIRNVRFINLKTALNITQSKNVTAQDVVLDGEDGKTGSYFEGFHNSMKFLSHTSDSVIEQARILRGVTHGFSVQRHANGNVFLNCELPPTGTDGMNSRIDFHSQLPWANLYDGLKNGKLNGSGGNLGTQPHSGPLNVIWNWDSEISKEQKVWAGYGQFQLQLPRTVFVGLVGKEDLSVQFAGDSGSSENEKVVTASIGKSVQPDSLYRAQVRTRLGSDPGPGYYPFIAGPSVVFVDQPSTWTAEGTASTALSVFWNGSEVPDSREFTATPTKAGWFPLELGMVFNSDEPIVTRRGVHVIDPKGILVDARAEGFVPISRNLLRTANGTLLQVMHTDPHVRLMLEGAFPYFRTTLHTAERLTKGSLMVSPLSEEGISLHEYTYRLVVENVARTSKPTSLRLVARDRNGTWAMSTQELSWDDAVGTYTSIDWIPLYPQFDLPREGFDPSIVNRVGFLMMLEEAMWTQKDNKLRFVGFRVSYDPK